MRLQVSLLLALLLLKEQEEVFGILLPEAATHHGSELLLAEQFLLTSEPGEIEARFRSAHLKVEEEASEGISDGLFRLAGLCEQATQLTLGESHAGLVAQRLLDLEGALILPPRLLVVPLQVGQDAQLVVALGQAGAVAQRLEDLDIGHARTDRTARAVSAQLQAMGCEKYEIGIRSAQGQVILRTWSAAEIGHTISWLKRVNAQGSDVYVRPTGSVGLILVDDLDAAALVRLKEDGIAPACVVDGSRPHLRGGIPYGEGTKGKNVLIPRPQVSNR